MTYHYQGIDAEESILTKSLPNVGTWALPNLFFTSLVSIHHHYTRHKSIRFFHTYSRTEWKKKMTEHNALEICSKLLLE